MSISEAINVSARHWLGFAVESEARRLGVDRDQARAWLAAKMQEAPGTLENLARNRLKRVDSALREKLRESFLRSVEREIGLLEHERDRARALGSADADAGEIIEIETHLAALRKIVARRKAEVNVDAA